MYNDGYFNIIYCYLKSVVNMKVDKYLNDFNIDLFIRNV